MIKYEEYYTSNKDGKTNDSFDLYVISLYKMTAK